MKTFFKFTVCLIILTMTFTGCSNDEDKIPDISGLLTGDVLFGVKTGKITYKYTFWYEEGSSSYNETVFFDDNGKRMRVETEDAVIIYDGSAEKIYTLSPSEKVYTESVFYSGMNAMYIFLGDEANSAWSRYPGFSKKANKTIAGKTCSVYAWTDIEDGETVEWGGWNRITFWWQSFKDAPETDDSMRIEATSFAESIPAGSFTVPSDYTKVAY